MSALLQLEWLKLRRSRSPRVAAGAVLLTILATLAARYAGGSGAEDALGAGLDAGFGHLLVYVLPFALASGAISEEVSERTLIYLTSRPVARPLLVIGKWGVAAAVSAGLLCIGCLLLHVGASVTDMGAMFDSLPTTLRVAASLCMLCAYLCGACLFYSALAPGAASILSALHMAGDLALSLAPGRMRLLSPSFHAQELAGFSRHGVWSEQVPTLGAAVHVGVLVVVCCVAVGAAAVTMQQMEYPSRDL